MNRHQRRAFAKVQGKVPLGQATDKLQQALEAFQSVKNLDDLPKQITEAHRLVSETHAMLGAMVEDLQNVADEVEALKTVVFTLRPEGAEQFKQILEEIRADR